MLGTYSITPDGDTTLRRYGVYRIMGGRLRFWKQIDAAEIQVDGLSVR